MEGCKKTFRQEWWQKSIGEASPCFGNESTQFGNAHQAVHEHSDAQPDTNDQLGQLIIGHFPRLLRPLLLFLPPGHRYLPHQWPRHSLLP